MAKWLPPNGFACKVHHLEAKVGGSFHMSFSNFGNGSGNSFGGEYLELVPSERLRYTDKFDDPNLPGERQVTVDLRKVSCGTEIHVMQERLAGCALSPTSSDEEPNQRSGPPLPSPCQ